MKKILKSAILFSLPVLLFFGAAILTGLGTLWPPGLKPFFYFIIFVPMGEEIIFRYFLLDVISKKITFKFKFLTAANVITAIIFTLFHIIFQPNINSVLVFFPALVFGFAKERTNSVITPIIIHGIYNLNVFINY